MGNFLIFLIVVAAIGACMGDGLVSGLPFLISIGCWIYDITNGIMMRSSFDDMMMFVAPVILFILAFVGGEGASKRKDQEYLDSLSPEKRKMELERRRALYFLDLKEREQKRQHEEQLKRDLEIIDKHYEKQYRNKHMFD